MRHFIKNIPWVASRPLLALQLFIALSIGFSACRRTSDPGPATEVSTNEWILEQMRAVYYWTDKIPTAPNLNQTPDAFFDSILYKFDATARPDGDRFSWINPNADELKASLSGETKTTGAEFQLYRKSSGDELAGRVQYVLPSSPAARAGIKRGDLFSKLTVDGTVATTTNFSTLVGSGTNYEFTLATYSTDFVANGQTRKATAEVIQENPIYLDTTYTIGSKKVGYLVYNQFVSSPNNSTVATYDQRIDQIFSRFKAAGVNEFILDLRYNRGGALTAATNLGSQLVKNGTDKVFSRREYNKTFQAELQKQYGNDFGTNKFSNEAGNVGSGLSRVFVLTGRSTASASELIINGLKPFMEVFLIGDVTVGKNVGSFTVSDDTKRIKWGLQPITFKIFNSLGQSDYTAGFQPNVRVVEPLAQPLVAFGDPKDALLGEAFFQITGSRTARRGIPELDATDRREVFSTLDKKAGYGGLYVEH